jgi:gas vesicle protein
VGLLCGAMVGATLALLLTPAPGNVMREDARGRFDGMMAEARAASEQKRKEMEAQLAQMTSPNSTETAIQPR